MKSNGSRNFLIGIIGIIIILFLLLQIVSTLAGSGAIAAENMLPNSLSTNAKPTADDFYKAASGQTIASQSNDVKKVGDPIVEPKQDKKVVNSQAKVEVKSEQKVVKKTESPEETMVTVSITGNIGRAHPFLPAVEISTRTESELPKLPYATYPQPPVEVEEDPEITKLMQTTISGIMFDTFAPSAR